jgi:hypothetical protein
MKVVINNCFGGFNLSDEGVKHYAKLAGITLYVEDDGGFCGPTYYTRPKESRLPVLSEEAFLSAPMDQRRIGNENYGKNSLYPRDIKRDDPHLVATVEQIGAAANGSCAELKVVEIPDGTDYEISEYDGNEHIAEKHRTWS